MKPINIVDIIKDCSGVSIPHPEKPGSRIIGFSVPCEKLSTGLGTPELSQLRDTMDDLYKNSHRNLHDPAPNAKEKLGTYDYQFLLYAKGWYKKTNTIEDLKSIISLISCMDKKYVSIKDVIKLLVNTISDLGQFNDHTVSDLLCDALFPFLNPRNLNPHELIIEGLLSIIRHTMSNDLTLPNPDPKYLPLIDNCKEKWNDMHSTKDKPTYNEDNQPSDMYNEDPSDMYNEDNQPSDIGHMFL